MHKSSRLGEEVGGLCAVRLRQEARALALGAVDLGARHALVLCARWASSARVDEGDYKIGGRAPSRSMWASS